MDEVRFAIVIMLFSRVAVAVSNTFTLEGNAMMSIFGPMAGGSLHYEHRFDDDAVTVRIAAAAGDFFCTERQGRRVNDEGMRDGVTWKYGSPSSRN